MYRGKKRGENEGILRGYQRKLLKAIDDIRKTKQEQRKMVDSQVTVLEVRSQVHITLCHIMSHVRLPVCTLHLMIIMHGAICPNSELLPR